MAKTWISRVWSQFAPIRRHTAGMSPYEKRILLLKYIELNKSFWSHSITTLTGHLPSFPTDFQDSDLSNINLENADLRRALLNRSNFQNCNLQRAVLCEAYLEGCNFKDAQLSESDFRDASLKFAQFQGCNLQKADLSGLELEEVNLEGSNLVDANLQRVKFKNAKISGANLTGANLYGAYIDRLSYDNSKWTPSIILNLHKRGIKIDALNKFPPDVLAAFGGDQEGLTLFFSKFLTPFDRFLIDSVIFCVLGHDTDCRVVEFQERDEHVLVRICAKNRDDLETIAEALYLRVWEDSEKRREHNLIRLADPLTGLAVQRGLTLIHARLERMSFRSDHNKPFQATILSEDTPKNSAPAWSWNLKKDLIKLPRPLRLFISYSPCDQQLRQQFETHLALLKRQEIIETWMAQPVSSRYEANSENQAWLKNADIIVMLISSDFIASDYIANAEIQIAFARHTSGRAALIPVIVRPTDWTSSPLGRLKALPLDQRPITVWSDRDEAWLNVANGIRRVAMAMAGREFFARTLDV